MNVERRNLLAMYEPKFEDFIMSRHHIEIREPVRNAIFAIDWFLCKEFMFIPVQKPRTWTRTSFRAVTPVPTGTTSIFQT